MVKDFTNETITNTAADSSKELLPSMTSVDEHTDHKQALLSYRHIISVHDR
jgi:hypothetical protein